jgi:hypothetical protein
MVEWLKENDVLVNIEQERLLRIANLEILLRSILSACWPAWMKAAVKSGSGPGIAPLFRNESAAILEKKKKQLHTKYGIETAIYHFNWSGNPLEPQYEKCLALSVHGQVTNIEEILNGIKNG